MTKANPTGTVNFLVSNGVGTFSPRRAPCRRSLRRRQHLHRDVHADRARHRHPHAEGDLPGRHAPAQFAGSSGTDQPGGRRTPRRPRPSRFPAERRASSAVTRWARGRRLRPPPIRAPRGCRRSRSRSALVRHHLVAASASSFVVSRASGPASRPATDWSARLHCRPTEGATRSRRALPTNVGTRRDAGRALTRPPDRTSVRERRRPRSRATTTRASTGEQRHFTATVNATAGDRARTAASRSRATATPIAGARAVALNASSQATCTTSALTAAGHRITAEYSGATSGGTRGTRAGTRFLAGSHGEELTGNFTASNKVYDGTTAATITGRLLSGAVVGDDVSLAGGTATFGTRT